MGITYSGETCGEPEYTKDGILAWSRGMVYHPENDDRHQALELRNDTEDGLYVVIRVNGRRQERLVDECFFSFDEMFQYNSCGICSQWGDHVCPR